MLSARPMPAPSTLDLMQGQIGVVSAPGAGSRFWLTLGLARAMDVEDGSCDKPPSPPSPPDPPALLAPPAAIAAPERALQATPPRQHTVLYIEDNEVNQLLMEGMLAQRPGIRLLMAELPLPGLALAVLERPDLILLDIQLPGMDGFEVLQWLRAVAVTRDIPVVAVSANAMPADRQKAADAGFVDYITKPVDLPLLLATVDRLLAG